jgi:hypothetical protein
MNEKCDQCDKPATRKVFDTMTVSVGGWLQTKPVGKPKLGCSDHPPVAEHHGSAHPK